MEKITNKQLEILILLYRFRFLSSRQIQQILKHKNIRRINYWLNDLTNRNIIFSDYKQSQMGITQPANYCLSTKSRKILLNKPDINSYLLRRAYRDRKSSNKFIKHHLTLGDAYLYFRYISNNKDFQFTTKTDMYDYDFLPTQRPDAYLGIKDDKSIKRAFLEIIDEGTPRFILRAKIERYFEYLVGKEWQESTGFDFPRVLLICPDERLQEFLLDHIGKVLEEEIDQIEFLLTTKDLIASARLDTQIWQRL